MELCMNSIHRNLRVCINTFDIKLKSQSNLIGIFLYIFIKVIEQLIHSKVSASILLVPKINLKICAKKYFPNFIGTSLKLALTNIK